MKKSWHPLLMKNQERVWLEEKRAVRLFLSICALYDVLILWIYHSSKRKRNSINFVKKRKRKDNCKNYNDYRKNPRGESGQRS